MTESPLTVASAKDLSLTSSNKDETLAAPRSVHSDENMSPTRTDAQVVTLPQLKHSLLTLF